jgi:RES domain-containing protein
MTRAWRLCSSRFPANSGTGAAIYGGRWNPKGIEAVYAASSAALAALEILVHYDVLPNDFVLTEIVFPTHFRIKRLEASKLPSGWDDETPIAETQDLGADWIRDRLHAVLSVPSTVVASEKNYVINPKHPEFARIDFRTPVPFRFDSRLK